MQNYDKTTQFTGAINQTASSLVTIFDGSSAPRIIRLSEFGKNFIYFGRDPKNDIVFTSNLVSAEHGRFVYKENSWDIEDKATYKNNGSTNGLICNNTPVISHSIVSGDFIRIDDAVETTAEGVLIICLSNDDSDEWEVILSEKIGREYNLNCLCTDIDATIERTDHSFYMNIQSSDAYINNKAVSGHIVLHEKDIIVLGGIKLVFTSTALYINRTKINSDEKINSEICCDNCSLSEPQNIIPVTKEEESFETYATAELANEEQEEQNIIDNKVRKTSRKRDSRDFWASNVGYYLLSAIIALIIWGGAVALWMSNTEIALIVMLACAIFGWQALTNIQPAMFIWMSWTGWIIYFIIKFILSALVGLFVAPFKLGKVIAGAIRESIQ